MTFYLHFLVPDKLDAVIGERTHDCFERCGHGLAFTVFDILDRFGGYAAGLSQVFSRPLQ